MIYGFGCQTDLFLCHDVTAKDWKSIASGIKCVVQEWPNPMECNPGVCKKTKGTSLARRMQNSEIIASLPMRIPR